jgi:hypothetical protein
MDLLYQRRDLGAFGLGTQRTLQEYAERFGIDYPRREIRPRTDLALSSSRPEPTTPALDINRASSIAGTDGEFTVVEVNPYAPRPFAFSDAAICLTESLRASGIPSRHICNAIPTRGAVVLLGWTPEWIEVNRPLLDPSRTFLFNAEQMGSNSPLLTEAYLRELGRWSILDYHEQNSQAIERLHGKAARVMTVPIIPCEAVRHGHPMNELVAGQRHMPRSALPRPVDVLFYGSVNARRLHVLNELEANGLVVEVVNGAYGADLAPAIQRAKMVLHVHYYSTTLFPALRVLQPVAQGVPVVCETSVFSNWNDWSGSGMVFADYGNLVQACVVLAQSPGRAAEVARQCWDFAQGMRMVGPGT